MCFLMLPVSLALFAFAHSQPTYLAPGSIEHNSQLTPPFSPPSWSPPSLSRPQGIVRTESIHFPLDHPGLDPQLEPRPPRASTPNAGSLGLRPPRPASIAANPTVLRYRHEARTLEHAAIGVWRQYWAAMAEAHRFNQRVTAIWAEARADYPPDNKIRTSPRARRDFEEARAEAGRRADLPTELREEQLRRAWTLHPEFLRLKDRLRPVVQRLEKALRLKVGGSEDERLVQSFKMMDAAFKNDHIGSRLAGAR